MAYDDGLAIGIELGQTRGDVAHRDVTRARKRRDRNFGRFADVQDEDTIASIEAGLERRRFDCADISHQATAESAALLFDVVRKQLDLRECRQLDAWNRKSERVALTGPDRFEMRLLVQDFLYVRIISQAFGMMVVEAFAMNDFAVAVLEREVQVDIVYRPVADIGDFAPDDQVRRHATRTHNQVVGDYHLELVVGDDLGLRMIVGGVHGRFRACLIAVFDLDASAGERGAGRTEGEKSRDCD